MCGDLEEDDAGGSQAFEGFRQHARRLVAAIDAKGKADPDDVNAYLDRLFADVIGRILADPGPGGMTEQQRLSLTPLVLARIAGLLSGHGHLGEDPLRRAIEALMMGYGEPDALYRQMHEHHHHHHDHDHDHDHDHHHHGGHGHSH